MIFFYDESSRGRKVLTDFLGEADLKALMSDGYNAYTFLYGELEKTDHLICMAHARVKFEKAYQYGDDAVAKEFADMISELYDMEDKYEMRGLSAEDIWTERQGNHTEDIVQSIRRRLDEELRKDNEYRSPYMIQALNYLDHFWGILHFGSDDGVEMSAVYHSIISTLKLCGKSVWNFFGDYFRCEVLGVDTYKEYLPALSR